MKLNTLSAVPNQANFKGHLYIEPNAANIVSSIIPTKDGHKCAEAMTVLKNLAIYDPNKSTDIFVDTINGKGVQILRGEPKDKVKQIFELNLNSFLNGLMVGAQKAKAELASILQDNPKPAAQTSLYVFDGARERFNALEGELNKTGNETLKNKTLQAIDDLYKASEKQNIEIRGYKNGATVSILSQETGDIDERLAENPDSFIAALIEASNTLKQIPPKKLPYTVW